MENTNEEKTLLITHPSWYYAIENMMLFLFMYFLFSVCLVLPVCILQFTENQSSVWVIVLIALLILIAPLIIILSYVLLGATTTYVITDKRVLIKTSKYVVYFGYFRKKELLMSDIGQVYIGKKCCERDLSDILFKTGIRNVYIGTSEGEKKFANRKYSMILYGVKTPNQVKEVILGNIENKIA